LVLRRRADVPAGRDLRAGPEQPLAQQVLERRPGAPLALEKPVHLPFAQERRVLPPRGRPVRELRQAPEPPGERLTLRKRALEALLADRNVEPRLTQRIRERPERVPIQRLRWHPA